MDNVFKYKIIKDWKIIVTYYAGDTTLDELKDAAILMSKDEEYSPNFSVINDLRDCNLHVDVEEVEGYVEFMKNDLGMMSNRIVSFLTLKPMEVVLSSLFSESVRNHAIFGKVFTTTFSAIKWLMHPYMNEEKFESIIAEMKTNG